MADYVLFEEDVRALMARRRRPLPYTWFNTWLFSPITIKRLEHVDDLCGLARLCAPGSWLDGDCGIGTEERLRSYSVKFESLYGSLCWTTDYKRGIPDHVLEFMLFALRRPESTMDYCLEVL
ncbi:MAG: hypothetical protein JSS66_06165 [Armatimonadetes bacterium]|nr:hypothetical protein [Armatimonadota bacterium]